MKIISINIRGLGQTKKREWVQGIIRKEQPDVMALQETKLKTIDDMWIEELWGNRNFSFAQKEVVGRSGGMLLIWDANVFSSTQAIGEDSFIAVKGKWIGIQKDVFVACVYGPQEGKKKIDYLGEIV